MDTVLGFIEEDSVESPSGESCGGCGGEIVLAFCRSGEVYTSCGCGLVTAVA